MKIRNPKSRFDLKIKACDRVLEVGGGHNPHPRADVIVDKYAEDNSHRGGDLRIGRHQAFLEADGENLPFEDKEFDYVICCHVLEHVEHPERFLRELSRVAKAGYLEVPSLIGEFLVPKDSHIWTCLELEEQLTLVKKTDTFLTNQQQDMGDLFLYYLPTQSLPFKLLLETRPDLLTVRYEWTDQLDFDIEPQQADKRRYFTGRWNQEMIVNLFPARPLRTEAWNTFKALLRIGATFTKTLLKGRRGQAYKQMGLMQQETQA